MMEALLIAAATGAASGLGALPFFVVDRLPRKTYDSVLGFGAGLMLAAALLGLLPAALAHARAEHAQPLALTLVSAGLLAGFLMMVVMDKTIPHWHAGGHRAHQHHDHGHAHAGDHAHADDQQHQHADDIAPRDATRQGMLIMGAITIHRIPEGFALGASFAAGDGHQLGILLAIAVGAQNACEGVVMAAPLRRGGVSRLGVLGITLATGLALPVAALAGYAFSHTVEAAMPVTLAFAAGALVTLTSHEIIPETHSHGNEVLATGGIVLGVIAMILLTSLVGHVH